jgi:hypothetical protein
MSPLSGGVLSVEAASEGRVPLGEVIAANTDAMRPTWCSGVGGKLLATESSSGSSSGRSARRDKSDDTLCSTSC